MSEEVIVWEVGVLAAVAKFKQSLNDLKLIFWEVDYPGLWFLDWLQQMGWTWERRERTYSPLVEAGSCEET
jgi:hypothetical protein